MKGEGMLPDFLSGHDRGPRAASLLKAGRKVAGMMLGFAALIAIVSKDGCDCIKGQDSESRTIRDSSDLYPDSTELYRTTF